MSRMCGGVSALARRRDVSQVSKVRRGDNVVAGILRQARRGSWRDRNSSAQRVDAERRTRSTRDSIPLLGFYATPAHESHKIHRDEEGAQDRWRLAPKTHCEKRSTSRSPRGEKPRWAMCFFADTSVPHGDRRMGNRRSSTRMAGCARDPDLAVSLQVARTRTCTSVADHVIEIASVGCPGSRRTEHVLSASRQHTTILMKTRNDVSGQHSCSACSARYSQGRIATQSTPPFLIPKAKS